MTQLYTEILETETLTNSRALILNNDKTVMSCSSGTAFPTTNLQVGMLCFRTDQNKLYELKDATPTWTLIADLAVDFTTTLQGKPTIISTNSGDFNTYVTGGVYQVSGNGSWTGSTNGPNTAKATAYAYGQLIVSVIGNIVVQTYIAHQAGVNGGTYRRIKFNAADWVSWSILWDSNNDGSGTGLDADLLRGLATATTGTANTIVQRDANGDITAVTLRGTNVNISGNAILGTNSANSHTIYGAVNVIDGDINMSNNRRVYFSGNTDYAYMQFISVSDNDSRLRISTGDNNNETFELGQSSGTATFTPRLVMNADGSITITSSLSVTGAISGSTASLSGNFNSASISQGGKLSYDSEQTINSGMNTLSRTAFSRGKALYSDPAFKTGLNGIVVYDNNATGTVTLTRVTNTTDSPTGSPFEVLVSHAGAAQTPGYGGFTMLTQTQGMANHTLALVFKAKLPVGYSFQWASNATGNNSLGWWATDRVGTGRYEDYVYVLKVGVGGSFSTTHFIYVENTGGAVPSAGSPLTWRLAYATVYDTDSEQFVTEDSVTDKGRYPWKYKMGSFVNCRALSAASSIFIREDGVIFNHGWNDQYQSGYGRRGQDNDGGTLIRIAFPYQADGPVLFDSVDRVSLQHYHGIAADTKNRIWTWGNSSDYQTGLGVTTDPFIPQLVKTETEAVTLVRTEMMGYNSYACSAYITASGKLYYAGSNNFGQAALGTTAAVTTFTLVPQVANQPWKDFYCDGLSSFGITSDATGNKLYAAGRNNLGQLGINGTAQQTNWVPCVLAGTATQLTGAKKVMLTSQHDTYQQVTIVLTNNGNLYGAGDNGFGVLGKNNTTGQTTGFTLIDTNVADFALGGGTEASMIYYKNDNSLWGIGYNGLGGLGMNDLVHRYVPVRIYSQGYTGGTTAGGGTPAGTPLFAKKVSSSDILSSSAFLDLQGRVWTAGDGSYGHQGNTGTDVDVRVFSQALINEPVLDIQLRGSYSGSVHTPMLFCEGQSGNIWASGYNSYGSMGVGFNEWIATPQIVHFQPT